MWAEILVGHILSSSFDCLSGQGAGTEAERLVLAAQITEIIIVKSLPPVPIPQSYRMNIH